MSQSSLVTPAILQWTLPWSGCHPLKVLTRASCLQVFGVTLEFIGDRCHTYRSRIKWPKIIWLKTGIQPIRWLFCESPKISPWIVSRKVRNCHDKIILNGSVILNLPFYSSYLTGFTLSFQFQFYLLCAKRRKTYKTKTSSKQRSVMLRSTSLIKVVS